MADTPQTEPPSPEERDQLEFDAFEGDRVGQFLIGNLKASPLAVGLASLGAVCLLALLTLPIYVWAPGDLAVGSAAEELGWTYLFYAGVVVPLTMAFYAWISQESGRLFSRIYRKGAFATAEGDYASSVRRARSVHRNWAWALISALIASLWIASWASEVLGFKAFRAEGTWVLNSFAAPISWLAVYMACMIFARQLSTVVALDRVFRENTLRFRPLHPDRAGGLGVLAQYLLTFGLFLALIASAALLVAGFQIQRFAELHFLQAVVVAYVVLAVLTFFGLFWSAHQAMADAKAQRLQQLSNAFDTDHQHALGALSRRRPEAFRARVDQVNHLHSLYKITEGLTVWPFDMATISRFGAVFFVPLVIAAAANGLGLG